MNIQLANVISDITGVSGQAIIGAILEGERDPWKLADLKHEMVKASREEVARSLEGNWRDDLLFELQQAVNSYHFVHQQMRACDRQIESFLASLPTKILERPPSQTSLVATWKSVVSESSSARARSTSSCSIFSTWARSIKTRPFYRKVVAVMRRERRKPGSFEQRLPHRARSEQPEDQRQHDHQESLIRAEMKAHFYQELLG